MRDWSIATERNLAVSGWKADDGSDESVKLHNNAWVNNALLLIAGEPPVALAALIYAQPSFSARLSPPLAFCCLNIFVIFCFFSLFLSLPLAGYVRLFSRHCTPHPPLAVACKQERAAESSESRSAGSSAFGSGRSTRLDSARLGSREQRRRRNGPVVTAGREWRGGLGRGHRKVPDTCSMRCS